MEFDTLGEQFTFFVADVVGVCILKQSVCVLQFISNQNRNLLNIIIIIGSDQISQTIS